jgi:CBS-domain-containing membrane protein
MSYQLWMSPITGYRRNGTRFTALKKIFIDNVTVRDIYEPLLCCRIDDPSGHVKETLERRQFDMVGVINSDKQIVGYVETANLKDGVIEQYLQQIKLDQVISDSTPLASLLNVLKKREFAYINHGAEIVGIITKADVNKPPVRIYVFGMVSLFEMHINLWIKYYYPESRWQEHISEKRLEAANRIYEERKGNNQDLMLLDCIQLGDKRDILAKTDGFLENNGFNKKTFIRFIRYVEKIRNELAHSQDSIIANVPWDDFVTVLEGVEVFLINSDSKIEQYGKQGAEGFVEYLTTLA